MGYGKSSWRNLYASQPKSDFQQQQEEIAQRRSKEFVQERCHGRGEKCFFKDCDKCYPN